MGQKKCSLQIEEAAIEVLYKSFLLWKLPFENRAKSHYRYKAFWSMPRMLCNRNGAISHLKTEIGFVEDFRLRLYN